MPGQGLCPTRMIQSLERIIAESRVGKRLARCQLWRQQRLQRNEVFLQPLDAQALPGLAPTPPLHSAPWGPAGSSSPACADCSSHPGHLVPSLNPLQRFHCHRPHRHRRQFRVASLVSSCLLCRLQHSRAPGLLPPQAVNGYLLQFRWRGPFLCHPSLDRWKTKAWMKTLSPAQPSIC